MDLKILSDSYVCVSSANIENKIDPINSGPPTTIDNSQGEPKVNIVVIKYGAAIPAILVAAATNPVPKKIEIK